MTLKKQYQKALEEGRIIIVGCKYSAKNGWVGFKVYEIYKNELVPIIEKEASYWNEKNGIYKCGAWGTDRRLEVILSIGYTLGLKFNEIKQNYKWLQDYFS
jgi:dissimilatory sulfite reductase (desulfoviridin) alpha/beta subunit